MQIHFVITFVIVIVVNIFPDPQHSTHKSKQTYTLWHPYIVIPLMLALNEWDDGPDLVSPTTSSSPVGRTRVQLVE